MLDLEWRKVDFTLAEVGSARQGRFQEAVRQALARAGSPDKTALFQGPLTAAGLTPYLSPAAAAIAAGTLRDYGGGLPCEPPDASGILLLVGPRDAKEQLLGA